MAENKTREQSDAREGEDTAKHDAPYKQDVRDKQGTRKEEEEMATTNDDPLLRERQQMYGGFIKFAIFAAASVAIVLILLAIFLL